ncbi:MAG: WD40/YVTN/BNR-like repeat-containing protein [Mycobacteriales bacterium]
MKLPLRSRVPVRRRTAVVLAVVVPLTMGLTASVAASAATGPSWRLVNGGWQASLRGLDAVSSQVAWASGSNGAVLRTTTGGRDWEWVSPRGTGDLQYRDVEAFDANHAVLMSIGNYPGSFRFYVTSNGGRHWDLTYRNSEPQAFYDCMSFFDRQHGIALSDPVNGQFRILATTDGGRSWHVQSTAGMPKALPGEFAFAASGTCLTTKGTRDAWFATGGASKARVFHSTDGGRTWTVVPTPIRSGPTAGIYSLAFRDRMHGLAVGGDYTTPDSAPRSLALTNDGGHTWTLVAESAAPGEYRSGSAWIPGTNTAIVVGPTGSDISTDGGYHWRQLGTGTFHAVDCAADGACWASGAFGRIAKLSR